MDEGTSIVSGYITTAGQWPPKEEPSASNRTFGGKLGKAMEGREERGGKVRMTRDIQAEMFAEAFPTEDHQPPLRIKQHTVCPKP